MFKVAEASEQLFHRLKHQIPNKSCHGNAGNKSWHNIQHPVMLQFVQHKHLHAKSSYTPHNKPSKQNR